jgi:hypothetical protein
MFEGVGQAAVLNHQTFLLSFNSVPYRDGFARDTRSHLARNDFTVGNVATDARELVRHGSERWRQM